jgi:hypothetical protein
VHIYRGIVPFVILVFLPGRIIWLPMIFFGVS